MPDAPEVKIKITAEDSGVAAAIKQLTAQLSTLKAKEKEVADSSLNLKEAFKGIIEVLAVEKLAEFANEVFQAGVKIARVSQITGISTETLSVYAQAAKDAGGEVADMQAAVGKLATVITQAEQGNAKAAKSLALVGLSTKDFIGLNSDQKLRKVTDALGAMPPGFQKAAAAQKLLGDATGATINAMQALAGDGFDHAREEAEKFGNVVSGDMARDLIIANAAMKDLKAEAEGAVLQFEAGFIPALTDVANAIVAATSGDGASGFKKMGEVAGEVFRDISIVVLGFTDTIGRNFAKASSDIQNLGIAAKDVLTKGFSEANRILGENVKADYKRIDEYFQARLDSSIAQLHGLSREEAEAKARIDAANARNLKNPKINNAEDIKGAIKDQQQRDELFRLGIEGKNKLLTEELTIEKAFAAQREAGAQSEYERGLLSLTDYFDLRKGEIEQANRRELESLQEEKANEQKLVDRFQREAGANARKSKDPTVARDPVLQQEYAAAAAKDQQEAIRGKERLAALDAKIQIATINGQAKVTKENLDRYKAEQEQLQKLTAFEKTILDIQGKTAEAAKIEADAKEAEYRLLLASKPGATQESIDAEVQKYRDLTQAAATFEETKKAGDEALKSLADERAAIDLRVQSGQIFQIQADEQIRDLETSRLANLNKIADAQLAAARATGNQADIQQALDFKRSVAQIEVEANDAAKDLAKIKGGFSGGLQSSFENFFDTGIVGARNLGQAFAGLADSITGSLRKIVAGMLAQIATEKLLKAIPGLSGKSVTDNPAAKIAASAAAGTAQAAPLTAAATALATSGSAILAGGTALATAGTALAGTGATLVTGGAAIAAAAIQLQAAADTLLIANAAGGGAGGKAEGGLMIGPGTGTSDSIPVRVSTGEFIMRAAAVRAIGVATLSSMNRGFNVGKMIHSAPVARFAEGGLVGGGGGPISAHQVNVHVGLEEGIVLKHLKSNAAGKVVVSHLANNPKSAQKAIGRSS